MDIFIIKLSDADNIKSELLEEFKHRVFSDKKKLKEHCFAYLMLDRILKEVYKIENREIEFIKNKPYLKTRKKFFSLSHSGEYLALAFSESECGLDIEKIKERDFKAIAKRMKFNCNSLEEFYKEWTKYEAEYKLGTRPDKVQHTKFHDYILCAVSVNYQEIFELYIQNGETFPNL